MTELAALGSIHFDLNNLPLSERGKRWSNKLNEYFYNFDIGYDRQFEFGRLNGTMIDGTRIATISSDPMTAIRDRTHISLDSQDFYFLLIPESTRIHLSQIGREACVEKGGFAIVSSSEAYRYYQPTRGTARSLIIPGRSMRTHLPTIDDWIAKGFHREPLSCVFTDFATSLCVNGVMADDSSKNRLGTYLLDLLALTLAKGGSEINETSVSNAHRRRVVKLIERKFRDPTFGMDDVVRCLKLSERYIQKILANQNETVSDLIRRRRILEARRLIGDRPASLRSISSIGHAVGYSDAAYFSRVFKRETGCSPSQFHQSN